MTIEEKVRNRRSVRTYKKGAVTDDDRACINSLIDYVNKEDLYPFDQDIDVFLLSSENTL